MARVVPELGDPEFSADLLVDFELRKPKVEFVLPKLEYIPDAGAKAWDDWLATRMLPTPVVDENGKPILDDEGEPKTEPRKPISDKEFFAKQIDVAITALAKAYPSVITEAKARKVVERLEAMPLGPVKWIYDEWVKASEVSMGESSGSAGSSTETSAGPSDTNS